MGLNGCCTTRIYCRENCPPGRRTLLRNRVTFQSESEAIASGYRACKVCKPDQYSGPWQPKAVQTALRIGGCDKAIKAREFEEQTHQAHATGAYLDTDQMDRQDQSMQEGKTRRTVKKGHDSRIRIEALVVGLPGLERAAGNIEQLGCLPMGEPLRLPSAVALKQCSAPGSLLAWVTIVVASLLILDDGSHGYLLVLKPRSSGKYMAKDMARYKPRQSLLYEFGELS